MQYETTQSQSKSLKENLLQPQGIRLVTVDKYVPDGHVLRKKGRLLSAAFSREKQGDTHLAYFTSDKLLPKQRGKWPDEASRKQLVEVERKARRPYEKIRRENRDHD